MCSSDLLGTDGSGNLSWVAQANVTPQTVYVDNFTGNGVQTTFTLSLAPASINNTTVNIDGVSQLRSAYSISTNQITFTSAPANGSNIEVTTTAGSVSTTSSLTTRTYTGDGSTVNYTVTNGVTATGILVTENGLLQTPTTDYTEIGRAHV